MGAISMMLISSAIAVQSVLSDQPVGANDRDRKAAYAAAEAGLQVYVHKLIDDNTYWAKCDGAPGNGLNQPWDKTKNATDPREWMNLPDNSARWTIEMLPVSPYKICDVKNPEASMISPGTPTFRIRITGQAVINSGTDSAPKYVPAGPKRSLIATFKRKSFLDYIYFTDFETLDPATFPTALAPGKTTLEYAGNNPNGTTQRDVAAWGQDACANYVYVKAVGNRPDGPQYRTDQRFKGTATATTTGAKPAAVTYSCTEITFSDNDVIQGPFHTNDTPQICGSPTFGRSPADVIEISGPGDTRITDKTQSWRNNCAGSVPDVNFEDTTKIKSTVGTWKFNQKKLALPKSNTSIKAEADPAYSFIGRTTLNLTSSGIIATGTRKDGTTITKQNIGYPSNGVVYVDNQSCTATYSTAQPDLTRTGCGIAVVSGTYNTDLTIAAADDILITDNVLRSGTAVLGLVANNFIRVNHPVTNQSGCATDGSSSGAANATGSITNLEIDAALLTLAHSFIVDNWKCGNPLGTLTVNGAIAQKFRGPVATGSGKTTSTGYVKNYVYDDRLRVHIPPKFIDPVESAWGIQTYQEQVPAW
ncbi:MAG: hypothetical protein AAGC46_04900 [Solirubrobacteraceae bacterium]|nr:hypothetical protein [Patulibacter sp.]